MAVEDFENDAMIAPPLSLSAPELSSCEPFDFRELRLSASSSEIMHELALIRLNQEVEVEAAESGLKKRYGLERKRSFERRSSLRRDNFSSSKENLPTPEQLLAKRKELLADLDSKRMKRLSNSTEELEERESRVEQFSERFLSLERGFQEYSALTNMKIHEDEESDRLSSYSDDDFYDDKTYHPRNMVPKAVREPVLPILQKPPMVTINEEPEPLKFESPKTNRKDAQRFTMYSGELRDRTWRGSPTPDREMIPLRRSRTPSPSGGESHSPSPLHSRSPSPNIFIDSPPEYQEKHSPPSLPQTPKPILKVRDKSIERLDSSQLSLNKKVRIDIPDEKEASPVSRKSPDTYPTGLTATPGSPERRKSPQKSKSPEKSSVKSKEKDKKKELPVFVQQANDIGIFAGEVARNRRKKQQQVDPAAMVIVDHYSDIVREFGQGKKAPPKIYLSYDELKAAAEKAVQEQERLAALSAYENLTDEKTGQATINPQKSEENENISHSQNKISTLNPRTKFCMEYMLDLFLFFVACWLYLFKDVRLTIPIIMLMAYRQLQESITNFKLPWRKKKD